MLILDTSLQNAKLSLFYQAGLLALSLICTWGLWPMSKSLADDILRSGDRL